MAQPRQRCDECGADSPPDVDVSLHRNNDNRIKVPKRELKRLYDIEKSSRDNELTIAFLLRHIEETNRERNVEMRTAETTNQILMSQIANLEELLMDLGGRETQRNYTQLVDASTQYDGLPWQAEGQPWRGNNRMEEPSTQSLLKKIDVLEENHHQDASKIQQLEAIIDMQNRRLYENELTYNKLMVKHKTMMKEE